MIIKLDQRLYEFLKSRLLLEKSNLVIYLPNSFEFSFEICDNIAIEIRDWASEKLQIEGYDKDYNLTENGKLFEQLEDIFYS